MSWEDKMERACMVGDQPMLNQVLKHVAPNCALSDGWFPVALSAASGQLGMLKAVLKGAKGDAERRLADGDTPLRLAAERGHADCVDCLLKIGADKDVTQRLSCGHVFHADCIIEALRFDAALEQLGVDTRGFVEKEDLVRALEEARARNVF